MAIPSPSLTVGQVAALIAGGVSLAHITIPLLIAVVIIAVISTNQHNAATWSAAGYAIQSSLWPTLLRGDGTVTRHVRWRVFMASLLLTFATVTCICASFFTPIPLKSDIVPSIRLEQVDFHYAPDLTFFGKGTPARPDRSINRLCSSAKWFDCPNSAYQSQSGTNYYNNQKIVNSTIPVPTADLFGSGTTSGTISGPLDIQYREFYKRADAYIDGNASQIVGNFRPLQSFLLENTYSIIEGGIVDSINGGFGLRNHTIPLGLDLGAEWYEDILWIQPVTACHATNLTLGFKIDYVHFYDTFDGTLTDDGGFANLAPYPPNQSWAFESGPGATWYISPPVPDLKARAYQAAWWNNNFTALALNVSNPVTGNQYHNGFSFYASVATPGAIGIDDMNGGFLDNSIVSNTSKIQTNDFKHFGRRCSGFDDDEPSNPSKPYIRCGYFYGIPHPAEPGQSWRIDLGSGWTQNIYTCASSVKASVKTVHFGTNGMDTLSTTRVIDVVDKVYPNLDAEPLWAVERVTGANVSNINLFWGIIDDLQIDNPHIWTKRGSELYLPTATQGTTLGYSWDGFAAGSAYTMSWNSVYEWAAVVAGVSLVFIPSYSGETNFGQTLKYRELSGSPEGAAKVLNLIWTDLASWATVGTKTGFETEASMNSKLRKRDPLSTSLGTRGVYRMVRIVRYGNILYAIPAFVVIAIWLLLLVTVLFLACFRQIRWRMLHHYVNQTSMARTATDGIPLPKNRVALTTSEWVDAAGTTLLNVRSWKDQKTAMSTGFHPVPGYDQELQDRDDGQQNGEAVHSPRIDATVWGSHDRNDSGTAVSGQDHVTAWEGGSSETSLISRRQAH